MAKELTAMQKDAKAFAESEGFIEWASAEHAKWLCAYAAKILLKHEALVVEKAPAALGELFAEISKDGGVNPSAMSQRIGMRQPAAKKAEGSKDFFASLLAKKPEGPASEHKQDFE